MKAGKGSGRNPLPSRWGFLLLPIGRQLGSREITESIRKSAIPSTASKSSLRRSACKRRGTVQEIGIRTTKIVDAGGNINIVNNSEITTVINQTQEISQASVTVGIEYGESLPRVEIVIRDNLDMIKEHIPAIIDGPFYKGVTALNSSSVDLLFVAKCREEDIFQVQRDMNRELKLLFDANNIGIPFPQIVVNEPATFNTKTTKRMETGARDFIEEQKEQSKGLEEENH